MTVVVVCDVRPPSAFSSSQERKERKIRVQLTAVQKILGKTRIIIGI